MAMYMGIFTHFSLRYFLCDFTWTVSSWSFGADDHEDDDDVRLEPVDWIDHTRSHRCR